MTIDDFNNNIKFIVVALAAAMILVFLITQKKNDYFFSIKKEYLKPQTLRKLIKNIMIRFL